MEKVVLKATKRTVIGKQVNALRRAGQLPAVIYGHHVEPIAITLDAHEAGIRLSRVSSSALVTLDVDGKEYPALVRERQRNYVKNVLIHVDFLAVSLTEKLRAKVSISLTGASLAVKDYNAVLVTGLDQLEVECLPQDLPERITLDISGLAQIGDGLHVRDIKLSDKVEVLDDPDEMIVLATAPKVDETEEAAAVAGAVEAEPELSVERGKKEDEEEEKK